MFDSIEDIKDVLAYSYAIGSMLLVLIVVCCLSTD
jgi:hypothetical protein